MYIVIIVHTFWNTVSIHNLGVVHVLERTASPHTVHNFTYLYLKVMVSISENTPVASKQVLD